MILVNDELVKASNAGRDCSLSLLEKRLGQFREREPNSAKRPYIPNEATEQASVTPDAKLAWLAYHARKFGHTRANELRKSTKVRYKAEREELKVRHKQERENLYDSRPSWRGNGKELNFQKSILAGNQLRERLLLQKKQKSEQPEQPSGKFLSYRKWLAANEPERIHEMRNWRKIQREGFKREIDELLGRTRTDNPFQRERTPSRDFGR